ncbi:MAG TPA: Rieske (2Fe-2S) protein [Cellvibrio sp.]|nr:Rieske (2Fe-2S) protein [Cellvibrio sp.]
MAFIALEKLHQLYDGYRRRVRVAGGEWLLIQEEGKLFCIANQCPHLGASLAEASVNSFRLRCLQHGMEFDLRTGRPLNTATCVETLRFMPLVYEGNQVGVDL